MPFFNIAYEHARIYFFEWPHLFRQVDPRRPKILHMCLILTYALNPLVITAHLLTAEYKSKNSWQCAHCFCPTRWRIRTIDSFCASKKDFDATATKSRAKNWPFAYIICFVLYEQHTALKRAQHKPLDWNLFWIDFEFFTGDSFSFKLQIKEFIMTFFQRANFLWNCKCYGKKFDTLTIESNPFGHWETTRKTVRFTSYTKNLLRKNLQWSK